MRGSIDLILAVVVGVVLLLVAIPFFISVFNPKAALAFTARAKVDALASAINDVCLTGEEIEIEDFILPQEEKAEQITLIQEFITKISGDPEYVLYYEAFPPGEALGWEVYHQDFGYRLAVLYTGGDINIESDNLIKILNNAKNHPEVTAAKQQVEAAVNEETRLKLQKKSIEAFFSNIILDGHLNFFTGEPIGEGKTEWGEWEKLGKQSDIFRFTSYIGMSNFEKTSVKHMACGDNSLCLKTKQGVVAYELDNCVDNGFDFIRLIEKENMPAFQLASPCKADITINAEENCNHGCVGYMEELPLYSMDANKLTKIGNHWRCVFGTNNDGKPADAKKPDKCITVNIKKDGGYYCYTNYKIPKTIWSNVGNLALNVINRGIIRIFDEDKEAIKEMRYYLPDTKSFMLMPNLLMDLPTFDILRGWIWP